MAESPEDVIRRAQQCHSRSMSWLTQVFPGSLDRIIREECWRGRRDRKGREFESFYAFATYPQSQGLGLTGEGDALSYDDAIRFCSVMVVNRPVAQLLRDQVPALGEHGGDRSERGDAGRGGQGDNITFAPEPARGTSSTYLTRRLKRDAPEVAEQLAAGEFRSVRQAAIAAGIIRPPSPEDIILREFRKLTQKQQERLLDKLGSILTGGAV